MSDSDQTTEIDTLRRQLAEMRAVAQDLVAHVVAEAHLTELSTRWLNDSTRWESDDYLGPQWQEIYNRYGEIVGRFNGLCTEIDRGKR